MKNSKLYCCYSVPLRDYLIQNGVHYCNYSKETAVICITTNKIFYSISEAAKLYNCFTGNIHKCCKGEYHTCGSLPDGTKLKWMYYDDYIKQNNLKDANELELHNSSFFYLN